MPGLDLDMFGRTPRAQESIYSTPTGVGLAPVDVGKGSNFRFFAEPARYRYFDFDG